MNARYARRSLRCNRMATAPLTIAITSHIHGDPNTGLAWIGSASLVAWSAAALGAADVCDSAFTDGDGDGTDFAAS